MAKLMGNRNRVLVLGAVLLLIVIFGLHGDALDGNYANWVFRYLHVMSGILWIGMLYYLNFVQIPTMPQIPAELKPGISKSIAPERTEARRVGKEWIGTGRYRWSPYY